MREIKHERQPIKHGKNEFFSRTIYQTRKAYAFQASTVVIPSKQKWNHEEENDNHNKIKKKDVFTSFGAAKWDNKLKIGFRPPKN